MATADQHIGRREAIGLGLEAAPGTAVAPQIYAYWYDNGLQSKTNVVENESALGVVDEINNSDVTSSWMEGDIGGKVADQAIGYLLTGFFGSPTTGTAEDGIYPHTFRMAQSSIPQTLSVTRSNPLETLRYSYGTVDSLEFTAETDDYVMFSAALKGRPGEPASATSAFLDETEFTSKHATVKLASDVGGLAAATNLKAVSAKLNLERPSEAFNPLGTGDEPEFDRGAFSVSGEVVVRYTDTQYEEDFLNNTAKALQLKLENNGRSLTFTLPQVRTRELERSGDRNEVVTQTLNLKGEYSLSAGYTVEAVLRNTRATYEAAS